MSISVIIPTFNRAFCIEKTIKSVLNQTLKPLEIIVIDDGSIDNTKEKLKNYPIKYIYQKNSGISSARNYGIKIANGKYIAFLDSDDIWHKDKLLLQYSFMQQNKLDFSHTGELWINNHKVKKQKIIKPKGFCFLDNISYCKISTSTIMLKKDIFKDIGYYDTNLYVCEDYDIFLRISYKYYIGFLKTKLTYKIAGHNNISFQTNILDKYRLMSLKKFINSKYKKEILSEINKKLKILYKGAIKYQNNDILNFIKIFINDNQVKEYIHIP